MADTSPKKKVAATPKKPAAHPKYSEMVGKAIAALKERGGSRDIKTQHVVYSK
jgi:histone H1/5